MKVLKNVFVALILLLAVGCEGEVSPKIPTPRTAPLTMICYMPWASNIYTSGTLDKNLDDMAWAIERGAMGEGRLISFLMDSPTRGTLTEFYLSKGKCQRKLLKQFNDIDPTEQSTITEVLNAAIEAAPAYYYAMSVSCHGMGWIPTDDGSYAPQSIIKLREQSTAAAAMQGVNHPQTRYFGDGRSVNTNTTTLARAIEATGQKMEFVLFDACYMSTIEVGYDLRNATKCVIGSPCEVMFDGFPYRTVLPQIFLSSGNSPVAPSVNGICEAFYNYYATESQDPYAAVAAIDTYCLDELASVMRAVNGAHIYDGVTPIQKYDPYGWFFDMGDYVEKLLSGRDEQLLQQFTEVMNKVSPLGCRFHTPYFYSAYTYQRYPISTPSYTGVAISDLSTRSEMEAKETTAWWQATH